MWNSIQISGKSHLFQCKEDNSGIIFHLTDFVFLWHEVRTVDEILQRSQELNKKIEYDRETVLDTIKTTPTLVELGKDEGFPGKVCNFKYYLQSRPFNFRWELQVCTPEEFSYIITQPLLLSLGCLAAQGEQLKKNIQKKDAEISQYKFEGAVLKRSTIATEPFSLDQFEQEYPSGSKNFINHALQNLSTIKATCSHLLLAPERSNDVVKVSSPTKSKAGDKKLYKSPKKMNKFQKYQKLSLVKNVKGGKVSYEDSGDSCTPPAEESDEIAELKRSAEELKRKQKEDMELQQRKKHQSQKGNSKKMKKNCPL